MVSLGSFSLPKQREEHVLSAKQREEHEPPHAWGGWERG